MIASIANSVRLLETLAGDAAEEVESCEEYQNAHRNLFLTAEEA